MQSQRIYWSKSCGWERNCQKRHLLLDCSNDFSITTTNLHKITPSNNCFSTIDTWTRYIHVSRLYCGMKSCYSPDPTLIWENIISWFRSHKFAAAWCFKNEVFRLPVTLSGSNHHMNTRKLGHTALIAGVAIFFLPWDMSYRSLVLNVNRKRALYVSIKTTTRSFHKIKILEPKEVINELAEGESESLCSSHH